MTRQSWVCGEFLTQGNEGMRVITAGQILSFLILFTLTLALGILTTRYLLSELPLSDFRGVTLVIAAAILIYLYTFVIYRLLLYFMSLGEGNLTEGSREEFVAQVNVLFYLVLFNALIRTHFLPVPLMRLIYIALGAHLGRNTYSAGTILDPPLTFIGDNSLIGHDAVLFAHAIEGQRFSLGAIRIGNNVTVGAHTIIMSDVIIGDGAIISAGAVVLKGSRIGKDEVWGGNPARMLHSAAHVPDGRQSID